MMPGHPNVTTRRNRRQRERNNNNKATIKQGSSTSSSSHRSPSPFGSSLETPMKSSSRKISNGGSTAISEAGLFEIKRTRSLDDQRQHQHQHQHQNNHNHQMSQEDIDMFDSNYCEGGSSSCCGDEKDEGTSVATALHSSFDVSLLRGGGEASCSSGDITLFEHGHNTDEDEDSQTIGTRNNNNNHTSFDTVDLTSPGNNNSSINNNSYQHHHLRPRRAVQGKAMSYVDLKPPATVRKKKPSESYKARRRSGDSATTATTIATSMSHGLSPFSIMSSTTPSRTPGRPRRHDSSSSSNGRTPVAASQQHTSPAPSSTAKRRRVPIGTVAPARQSPMRRLLNTSSQSSSSAISSLLNTPPTPFQNQFAPPLFGGAQPQHQLQHQHQQATSCTKGVAAGDKNNYNNYSLSTQTPTHQNLSSSSDPYGSFFKKVQPYHTGSTGVTHLETTFEADGDSVDTNNNNNSPARFRFTSFPASLPRVHHANHYPRSTPPVCPGSVRKRMSFDTEDDEGVAENPTNNNAWKGNTNTNEDNADNDDDNDPVGLNYSNHQHDAVNQSRDDDGTNNTSLSSLSVEGGHHQHLPHLPHQHPAHFASAPSKNLLLFPGEQQDADNDNSNNNNNNTRKNKLNEFNNNLLGYSDDEDEDDDLPPTIFSRRDDLASPDQGAVRRTRLNFNVFLSPTNTTKKSSNSSNHQNHHNTKENEFGGGRRMDLPLNNVDLSRPYESQNRINSFHSSISSQTQLNNSSTHANEDGLIVGRSSSSPPLTPSRIVLKNNCNPPKTPHEVHLHFSLESECSPILGVPKQEFGDTTANMLDRRPQQLVGNNPSAATSSSATTSLLGNNRFGVPNKSTISSPSHSAYSSTKLRSQEQQKEDANNTSISSSSESSSTATQKRRLRPMPDMSAFETVKTSSSVRIHRTLDDGATAGDVLRVMPMPMPSLKIRRERERPCPPTPQRTPAWANEGGSHVFNSLISNKVLLSCPSQVLEGRSSLETSVLDEDSKASGSRRNSFSNSYDRSISAKSEGIKNNHALPHGDDDDDDVLMDVDNKCGDSVVGQSAAPVLDTIDKQCKAASRVQITAPPKLMRRLPSNPDTIASVSFSGDFEILGSLGSGAFADVYKVRLKSDNQLYAVKRNRRQFRGKRDRDVALAEVQSMQRLQSVFATHNASGDKKNEENNFKSISSEYNRNCYSLYLLFFYRAWQEDGYFYSQTELCCRDTCREMLDSLRFLWNSAKKKYPSLVQKLPPPSGVQAGSQLDAFGRLVPNMSVWKICHDISAGLSHIHSHGIVHQDIKPSNIFFVTNARFGAMCKIGDFGLAGSIGSSGDGQEGDTRYLPPELLASATRHTSSDIFSLGLTLYEIATDEQIEMPSEGQRWHQLRSSGEPTLPACRGENLQRLLQSMTDPDERNRPTANTILNNENVKAAGNEVDTFLLDYIKDVEEYDRLEEERLAMDRTEDQTPRNGHRHTNVRSPSLSMLLPPAPNMFSPQAKIVRS